MVVFISNFFVHFLIFKAPSVPPYIGIYAEIVLFSTITLLQKGYPKNNKKIKNMFYLL